MSTPKLTEQAGLKCNTNRIGKGIKVYYNDRGIDLPKFSKTDVVVGAAIEKTSYLIINEACKHVSEDKSGLKTITRPVFKLAVQLNDEMRMYYGTHLKTFDPDQTYLSLLPITTKDIGRFLEEYFSFARLTNKALNYLCFLIFKLYVDILRLANELNMYANKKTFSVNTIRSAIRILFKETSICNQLLDEINRAWGCVADIKDAEMGVNNQEEVDEVKDEESDQDSDNESDVEETKTAKTTKTKVEQLSEETDSDEDEESEEEAVVEEVDSESESEEEVVEVKPKPKKSRGGRGGRGGRRKNANK